MRLSRERWRGRVDACVILDRFHRRARSYQAVVYRSTPIAPVDLPHISPLVASPCLPTCTVASSRLTKLFLAAVALFIATSAILASIRLGGRVPSILQYVKPSPLRHPLYTQPFRPLTNSTMAPSQYKTPPQLPPKFTATKESLVNDAKRLVRATLQFPSFRLQLFLPTPREGYFDQMLTLPPDRQVTRCPRCHCPRREAGERQLRKRTHSNRP